MAAGDFTKFLYPDIKARLEGAFPTRVIEGNSIDQASFNTAQAVIANQGARPQGIFVNGVCTSWKIQWLKDCTLPTVSAGVQPDCDVEGGLESDSDEKTYDINEAFRASATVKDQDCTTDLATVELMAMAIQKIVKALDKETATKVTAHVLANAQSNLYTGTYGNITVPTRTEFTAADFAAENGEKILSEIRLTAAKNYIDRYIIVDDTNFFHRLDASRFANCCSKADFNANITDQLFIQDWELNAQTTHNSTFLIDPEHIAFMGYNNYSETTPTLEGDRPYTDGLAGSVAQIWRWNVPSGKLTWRQFSEGGGSASQVPLRYDFEMKKVCTGRDARNRPLYDYAITGVAQFLLDQSPMNCDSRTGILHFAQV